MVYTMNTVITNLSILSLFFFCTIYLCIWPQPSCRSSVSIQANPCDPPSQSHSKVPKDELGVALNRASTANKTVIITVVNKAYVEPHGEGYPSMFDLFLESFWLGENTRPLIDHLLFVAVDQTAYYRCRFRGLHCYRLQESEGVDFTGEKLYMSTDFIEMMWTRTLFLLDVLKRGYNFIFTDTDVIWLRNPFLRLKTNENDHEDLQISTDSFDSPYKEELINTGFYYVRSNNRTVSLFETWYATKDNYTGMKEQDVLVRLRAKGVVGRLGIRVRILETLYFNGFCNRGNDFRAVITVHANCCRSISAKVADLTAVLRDWKRFKAATRSTSVADNITDVKAFRWSSTRHIACWNSWKEPNKT